MRPSRFSWKSLTWVMIILVFLSFYSCNPGESLSETDIDIGISNGRNQLKANENVAVSAKSKKSGVEYRWELIGQGSIDGNPNNSAIIYKAPSTIQNNSSIILRLTAILNKNIIYKNVALDLVPSEDTETSSDKPRSPTNATTAGNGNTQITSIKDGDKVSNQEFIQGSCDNIPDDRDLWLIVSPRFSQIYHPQSNQPDSGPISIGGNGIWEGIAYFGRGPHLDNGVQFELLLVTADKTGSHEMQSYLVRSHQMSRWPGMSLPKGTKTLQKITVIRR